MSIEVRKLFKNIILKSITLNKDGRIIKLDLSGGMILKLILKVKL